MMAIEDIDQYKKGGPTNLFRIHDDCVIGGGVDIRFVDDFGELLGHDKEDGEGGALISRKKGRGFYRGGYAESRAVKGT